MSVKLYIRNDASQVLLISKQRMLQDQLPNIGITCEVNALALALIAQTEEQPVGVLQYVATEDGPGRLVLTSNIPPIEPILREMLSTISDIQPQLPVESSSLESTSLTCDLSANAFRIVEETDTYGGPAYTLEITSDADKKHSIEISQDQVTELESLNRGERGEKRAIHSICILTDSPLYHKLVPLLYPDGTSAPPFRKRNAPVSGANCSQDVDTFEMMKTPDSPGLAPKSRFSYDEEELRRATRSVDVDEA